PDFAHPATAEEGTDLVGVQHAIAVLEGNRRGRPPRRGARRGSAPRRGARRGRIPGRGGGGRRDQAGDEGQVSPDARGGRRHGPLQDQVTPSRRIGSKKATALQNFLSARATGLGFQPPGRACVRRCCRCTSCPTTILSSKPRSSARSLLLG